ncbi:hypothetical protein ACEPPN_003723 [Leptodophora sp. 'Broadleaf-Isolate-01']
MDHPTNRVLKPSGDVATMDPRSQSATSMDMSAIKSHLPNGGAVSTPPPPSSTKPQLLNTPFAEPRECHNQKCDKVEPKFGDFKNCVKCKMAPYCSKECKKNDRKAHKKECPELDKKRMSMKRVIAEAEIQRMEDLGAKYVAIGKDMFIEDVIQKYTDGEMMERYIDAFRLSRLDKLKERKERNIQSGILGDKNPQLGFKKFLDSLEQRDEIYAPWLRIAGQRKACERLANLQHGWSNIHQPVTEAEIKDHYGGASHLAVLRGLAGIAHGTVGG